MATPIIQEQIPLTQSELHEGLQHIQKRDGELSFRTGKTLDHLNHLSLLSEEDRKARLQAIEALDVPRLKPVHIAKILDVYPRNIKELGVVLSGYTLTVNKEYQQKIIDALA